MKHLKIQVQGIVQGVGFRPFVHRLALQNNLKETEDKIAYARQFYNDSVLVYKNKLEMFPSNIVASIFNFKPEEFFEATEAEKETPQVKF